MQMPSSVVLRRTADLVPYANNARTHTPQQVKQIAASERRAARGRGPLRLALGREKTDHGNKAVKPTSALVRAAEAAGMEALGCEANP